MTALFRPLLLVALAGCGTGPSITALHCDDPCQATENPFEVHLVATFEDPLGQLPTATLVVTQGDRTAAEVPLAKLVTAGKTSGSVPVSVPVIVGEFSDGAATELTAHARLADGAETSDASITLLLKL